MQRERRRQGRAIRKARRERREALAALDLSSAIREINEAFERVSNAFAEFARQIALDLERATAPLMAYYRQAVFASEQQAFRDRLALRALEAPRRTHAEKVVVEAWPVECIEGECEHSLGENGHVTDAECPPGQEFAVCVDCMDEKGAGRDEERWDEVPLEPWPHPGAEGWTETAPSEIEATA